MTRPKLTEKEARALIEKHCPDLSADVVLIGIRGYYKRTMGDPTKNDRNIYDDAFFVIGPGYYKTFNANTDPSKYKKGIGSLKPGLHWYRKDYHHKWDPKKRYPAFRPATHDESLPGYRDGMKGEFKIIAANIHAGGETTTGSEACQTVKKSQWKEFQTEVYELMDKAGQELLPYLLIEN